MLSCVLLQRSLCTHRVCQRCSDVEEGILCQIHFTGDPGRLIIHRNKAGRAPVEWNEAGNCMQALDKAHTF